MIDTTTAYEDGPKEYRPVFTICITCENCRIKSLMSCKIARDRYRCAAFPDAVTGEDGFCSVHNAGSCNRYKERKPIR